MPTPTNKETTLITTRTPIFVLFSLFNLNAIIGCFFSHIYFWTKCSTICPLVNWFTESDQYAGNVRVKAQYRAPVSKRDSTRVFLLIYGLRLNHQGKL